MTTPRLVAITACPTGIAHTYMAAEGLVKAARAAGVEIKVETQGSIGPENVITAAEAAAADAVIIAADTKVSEDRFVGKPIVHAGAGDAIRHGPRLVAEALAAAGLSAPGAPAPAAAPPPSSPAANAPASAGGSTQGLGRAIKSLWRKGQ